MNSLRDRAEALAAKLNKIGAFALTPFVVSDETYGYIYCEAEKLGVMIGEDDKCGIFFGGHWHSEFRGMPTGYLVDFFEKFHYSNQ